MGAERIDPAASWVPRERTLPRAEQAPRLERFDELVFRVRRGQHRPEPTTLRLTRDGGAKAAAGVRDLIRLDALADRAAAAIGARP